jgi:predicted nuclease of predicted toxin-antitoxin system
MGQSDEVGRSEVMRFLANENIPLPSVEVLRIAGHNVVSVKEEAPSLDDPSILAWAVATQRTIITLDRDYGDLVFRDRREAPAGIVLIRFQPLGADEIGYRILDFLTTTGLSFDGMLTVLRRHRHRQRSLAV